MDEGSHTTKICQAIQAITQRFVRGLGIGGLAAIVFLGLADRVNATYFHSNYARAPAGDYIDRGRYYYGIIISIEGNIVG